jgi:GxxExxY protein
MNTNKYNYPHEHITEVIIACFYKVYNTLGYGFLEKVYENAMVIELRNQGLLVKSQHKITVYYESSVVGEYVTDIIVEEKVVVEIKASEYLMHQHECQLLNYLKATRIEVGLLLNFGKNPEIKRKIHTKK